jgi:hypothetical protein
MKMWSIFKGSVLVTFGYGLLASGLIGCGRRVNVTKQMTWECAPDEYNATYYARPDEYVRFRFVEEPRCFEVESARNLCAELRSIGKPVVSVNFEVFGGPKPFSPEGYKMLAVEGLPLRDAGGWADNGSKDFSGVCPIGKVIDSLNARAERQQ